LDLLDVAVRLAIAEEAARQVAGEVAKGLRVTVTATPVPPTVTKVIHLRDVKLPATLVDEQGQGHMSELVIRSGTNEYVLKVIVDGIPLYHEHYSWFESMSQVVKEIAAFQEEDGTYILHLADIRFSKSLRIMAESLIILPLGGQGTIVELGEFFCKLNVARTELLNIPDQLYHGMSRDELDEVLARHESG
jgi:hypothetical protein